MLVRSLLLFAVAAPLACAADLPKRKSGLWELSTATQQGQMVAAQMCIDQKSDDLTRQLAGVGVTCSKQNIKRESATRYVIDSVCRFGDSTATSRAIFTGSFESDYSVDISAKYSPPMMGMNEGRSTIKARWLSACKSGQRPGDLVMPNGMTINVFDSKGTAPPKR
ncbi:MAG TPA: DUF3617 family protein [Casimicrobiaceae bacterium]|nr:DUF3617 family protein [Casimicrobiaceae bacterium]